MLMIRSPGFDGTRSGWPQAGHFDCTPAAPLRSFGGATSITTVRMRCVPHFSHVQPVATALAIGTRC